MGYKLAIDGPAGSGKSTIANIIAKKNNFTFISTGFLFRSYAYVLLKNNFLDKEQHKIIDLLKNTNIELKNSDVFINGNNVTNEIKNPDISLVASQIATKSYIRSLYIETINKIISDMDVVIEGRDIGTIVMPDANLKIYLNASIYNRTIRRKKELNSLNQKESFFKIWFSIFKRDYNDKHRKIAPLKKAKDAIVVNTDNKSIDHVVQEIQKNIIR